jgi:hypothetical protein
MQMGAGGYESWFVVELTVRRPGQGALTLSSRRGAYEFGTREPMPEG